VLSSVEVAELHDSAHGKREAASRATVAVAVTGAAAFATFTCYLASRSPYARGFFHDRALMQTLFSENAFYFGVFKHLATADSWTDALSQLRQNDWFTYPERVDLLRTFNFVQELVFAALWRILPGTPASLVQFYALATLAVHALTLPFVTAGAMALTRKVWPGAVASAAVLGCAVSLFSRYPNAPALRENVSLPFLVLNLMLAAYALKRPSVGASTLAGLFASAAVHAATWQFSSVTLAVKHIALFACAACGLCSPRRVRLIAAIDLLVYPVLALGFDESAYYLCPWYVPTALACVVGAELLTRRRVVAGCIAALGVVALCKLALRVLGGDADAHMLAFLASRIGHTPSFDSWLYENTESFSSAGWEQLGAFSIAIGIPLAAAWICCRERWRSMPHLCFLAACGLGYLVLAVAVRRLSVLCVPILSVVLAVALSTASRQVRLHRACLRVACAALIAAVIFEARGVGRQPYIAPDPAIVAATRALSEVTPDDAVVGSDMVLSAAVALEFDNRFKTVVHPYYESASNRERANELARVYGYTSNARVHSILRRFGVDYLVIREEWCMGGTLAAAIHAQYPRETIDLFCSRSIAGSGYFTTILDSPLVRILRVL
jgi:hypothetical protein